MLTLTCSVTARYRENGGQRYVLEVVASQCAISGVAEPQGIDQSRTHVAIHDRGSSITRLKLNDLDPARFKDGGCLMVAGALGWAHLNIFLGLECELILADLDVSLENASLFVSISIDGIFAPAERAALEQWLAGERTLSDLPLSTDQLPATGLVRRQ